MKQWHEYSPEEQAEILAQKDGINNQLIQAKVPLPMNRADRREMARAQRRAAKAVTS